MLRTYAGLLLSALALTVGLSAAAPVSSANAPSPQPWTHPCLAYETNPLPDAYGTLRYGWGSEANINDLTFVKPLPSPDSLTHEERYMLAGLKNGPTTVGRLPSWRSDLFSTVNTYYAKYHVIPDRLNEDMITNLYGARTPANLQYEFLRSPITGEYPRLNATDFSPGDVYIRPLTDDEIQHFCKYDWMLNDLVQKHSLMDPAQGPRTVSLMGSVFYVRIYGYKGVIDNSICFTAVPRRTTGVSTAPTGND
jgi:hypothetical protein